MRRMVALAAALSLAACAGADKPDPAYRTCVDALRSAGYSEGDPRWLTAVGTCMERISPSTTR